MQHNRSIVRFFARSSRASPLDPSPSVLASVPADVSLPSHARLPLWRRKVKYPRATAPATPRKSSDPPVFLNSTRRQNHDALENIRPLVPGADIICTELEENPNPTQNLQCSPGTESSLSSLISLKSSEDEITTASAMKIAESQDLSALNSAYSDAIKNLRSMQQKSEVNQVQEHDEVLVWTSSCSSISRLMSACCRQNKIEWAELLLAWYIRDMSEAISESKSAPGESPGAFGEPFIPLIVALCTQGNLKNAVRVMQQLETIRVRPSIGHLAPIILSATKKDLKIALQGLDFYLNLDQHNQKRSRFALNSVEDYTTPFIEFRLLDHLLELALSASEADAASASRIYSLILSQCNRIGKTGPPASTVAVLLANATSFNELGNVITSANSWNPAILEDPNVQGAAIKRAIKLTTIGARGRKKHPTGWRFASGVKEGFASVVHVARLFVDLGYVLAEPAVELLLKSWNRSNPDEGCVLGHGRYGGVSVLFAGSRRGLGLGHRIGFDVIKNVARGKLRPVAVPIKTFAETELIWQIFSEVVERGNAITSGQLELIIDAFGRVGDRVGLEYILWLLKGYHDTVPPAGAARIDIDAAKKALLELTLENEDLTIALAQAFARPAVGDSETAMSLLLHWKKGGPSDGKKELPESRITELASILDSSQKSSRTATDGRLSRLARLATMSPEPVASAVDDDRFIKEGFDKPGGTQAKVLELSQTPRATAARRVLQYTRRVKEGKDIDDAMVDLRRYLLNDQTR